MKNLDEVLVGNIAKNTSFEMAMYRRKDIIKMNLKRNRMRECEKDSFGCGYGPQTGCGERGT
jgi:hypothetical protein